MTLSKICQLRQIIGGGGGAKAILFPPPHKIIPTPMNNLYRKNSQVYIQVIKVSKYLDPD